MHYTLEIMVFYLLQTQTAMVTNALGMKKCNRLFVFSHFIYNFMFDKLENNFLLYMIISIYSI